MPTRGAAIDATLLVIAKAPTPGKVKTRLCPPCTPHEAARIAEAALTDTLAAVSEANVRRTVIALDGEAGPWLPENFVVIAQSDGGLDRRLAAAFAATFGTGSGPVLLVGMDTPQLTAEHLRAACAALIAPGCDAVLGLADDGGWWSIGLHARDDAVFLGVAMSEADTGAAQAARLHDRRLAVTELGILRDVDTFADAQMVSQLVPRSNFARQVEIVAQRVTQAHAEHTEGR